MHTAMNIGVIVAVQMADSVDDGVGLLATGGVVEINQGFVTNFFGKNRKIGTDFCCWEACFYKVCHDFVCSGFEVLLVSWRHIILGPLFNLALIVFMATVNPAKHLTNLDEWRRLGEAAIFPPDNRLELINGEILEMAPIGFNHAGHVIRLLNFFAPRIANKALLNAQNPLQLSDLSEPEPDFMLLKPNADFYSSRHPTASDVLLLIEVADTSLKFDQNQKLHLYAVHGIPEYWLLNLNDLSLEVYRKPNGEVYAEKTTLHAGDNRKHCHSYRNITLDVADIL